MVSFKEKSIIMFIIYLFPLTYFIAKIIGNKSLYGIKDILIIGILLFLLTKSYPKIIYITISIIFLINVYALSISYNDILFYILSIREFLFYPLFGILLGYYLARDDKYEYFFYRFIMFSFILTVVYLIIFPYDSFGSTLRLKSFWDREHEPAIIAGVVFIWTLYSNKSKKFKFFILVLSIMIMLLSASRSVILGIFLILFLINIRKFSITKIIALSIILVIGLSYFSKLSISGRGLNHNLGERTSQYELAISNFENNNFLGLGTDKYGVVGSIRKQYCYNGHCTTSMDSTLIKYTVNYGLIFLLPFIIFLSLLLIYYIHIKTDLNKKVFSTLIFSLVLGAITGKLGAFPLNIIFYMTFGLFLYHLNLSNINRRMKYEKNIIHS